MRNLLFCWLLSNLWLLLGVYSRVFEISDVQSATTYLFTVALPQWLSGMRKAWFWEELVFWRGGFYSFWASPAFWDTNHSCLEANTSDALYLNCFRGACPFCIFQAVTLLVALRPLLLTGSTSFRGWNILETLLCFLACLSSAWLGCRFLQIPPLLRGGFSGVDQKTWDKF